MFQISNSNSEEVFEKETLAKLANTTAFSFHEVISLRLGRCYTVCHLMNVSTTFSLRLALKSSWNYKVYLHQPLEELWLGGTGYFPTESVQFTLGMTFFVAGLKEGY
jgi:hypothetical protein